ncbi:DUF4376 domain-containing protein [Verticiella sediminum]|uniref:DUF4376 domain-containing protein n=1 Tax=Verticiella sediminum TaxID=1247510 RepID=A0A556API2_9BURK|nr:DUF4376 domain-containing protein [Verticiella sediminum]TSH94798.1 DUF4376 domain-containing protein [Verticiella sediminum]
MIRTILRIPVSALATLELQPMPGTVEADGYTLITVLGDAPDGQVVARYEWDGRGPLYALTPLDEAVLLAHLVPVLEYDDEGNVIAEHPPTLHMPVEISGWPPYDTAVPPTGGPDPVDPPPATRVGLMAAATAKRWAVMTGGLTLPGGLRVGTAIDDQNRLTSVVANAAHAGLTDADTVDFKATSGWMSITIGEVKAIAGAIGQFVQACYSAERAHHDAIAGLTEAELAGYDIGAGWPPSQAA